MCVTCIHITQYTYIRRIRQVVMMTTITMMIIKGTERPKIETISKLIIKIPSLIAVFCLNLIISRDNMFENFEFSHNRKFSHTNA